MTTRRNVLIAGAGLGAAACLGGGALLLWPRGEPSGLGAEVDAWLLGLSGSGRLGQALVAADPALEGAPQQLAERLRQRLGLDKGDIPASTFSAAVSAAIARDFERGDTVAIDGWVLARSETELAVLRYLSVGAGDVAGADSAREALIVEVERWGPQRTVVGQTVNEQSDGHSGIWFVATGAPPWLEVAVDGERMPTQVFADRITSGLFDPLQARVLAEPGEYAVTLHDDMSGTWQLVGHFVVVPQPPRYRYPDGRASAAFCPIDKWGPSHTAGNSGNPQTGGRLGIWIRTPCLPPRTRILFDGEALDSTPQEGLITAMVAAARLQPPGIRRVELHDPDSGETILVGEMQVTAPDRSGAD